MIVRRMVRYFDERFGSSAGIRFAATKIFPDHWSFYLGEFAFYAFVLLVATGVWLTFVYDPSPGGAYDSVVALSRATPVGYLMRQVHHWSAVMFVAAILLHMARIFFTGAFRKPRELNWVIGFLLLTLASVTGFTGYSLPYDVLSGTGLRITDSALLAIPFVGGFLENVLNGGSYPGPLLLSHLYTFHVYFLPMAIAALLAAHLGMMVFQKHTQFVNEPKSVVGRRMWPDYALRAGAAFTMTVGVILALASTLEINPIDEFGPYTGWTVPNPAAPDWYAAFVDGALRLGPAIEVHIFGHPIPSLFWPGIVMPTIALAVLICWPWIDARFTGDARAHDVLESASDRPWRVGFGCAVICAGILLTLVAGDDQQAFALHIPVESLVRMYQVLVPFGSLAVGWLAFALAGQIAARRRVRELAAERVVGLRRNVAGGFDAEVPETAA